MAKLVSDCQPIDFFAFLDDLTLTLDVFADHLKLVDIVLTISVTTALNERLFSTLNHVKKLFQNSYGDERLSDLFIPSCLSEDAKHLDLWDVIIDFAQLKSRRYPLVH